MPRIARVVYPGQAHHIVQRGNNKQDVFFVDDDRHAYLDLLAHQSALHHLRILAYCLMTNHVHLIAIPDRENSLARAVGRTHWLYTQYINRLHRRTGHLWQNRFFSCTLDERHLWQSCAYVERNPVRARLVRLPWRYEWSSAAAHIGEAKPPDWLDIENWKSLRPPGSWRRHIDHPPDEDVVTQLRFATHRGRPLATDSFISKLERKLGRRLRAAPVGRPKGSKNRHRKRRKNR